jgi:glutathione S-transferase
MPKLYFAPPSPYARKIRVLIAEKGIGAKVELIARAPFDKPADLVALNPLSKVPTLPTDDGQVLYDSPVIADYLDTLAGARLIPIGSRSRWDALRQQALADGILDAGVSVLLEGRRPEGERSPGWIARQIDVIGRSLDAFEAEIGLLAATPTIGHIACGCALGWLDFRMPSHDWRGLHPQLALWFALFSGLPSMIATKPD